MWSGDQVWFAEFLKSFSFYLGSLPFVFQFLVYCLQDGARGSWARVGALLTHEAVDMLAILICMCVFIL